jgi:hypothetical protein
MFGGSFRSSLCNMTKSRHVSHTKTYIMKGKDEENVTCIASETMQGNQSFRNAGAMSRSTSTTRTALLALFLMSIPPNVGAFQNILFREIRSAPSSRLFRSCMKAPRSPMPISMVADTIFIEAGTDGEGETLRAMTAALVLKSRGFTGVEIRRPGSDSGQGASPVYRYMPAVGMFKLITNGQEQSNLALPAWLSPEPGEERLLEARGWGFLSPDSAEPLSALDIDAAIQESTYVPAWAAEGAASRGKVSDVGFNITRMSQNQVLEAAQALPQLSQDSLLRGVTEPAVRQCCHMTIYMWFSSFLITDVCI